MGRFFIVSMIIVSFWGCRKSFLPVIDRNLIGRWVYVESYYSVGGPGKWHPVLPSNQKIEFKPNGQFIPPQSFLRTMNWYVPIDSVTIKFQPSLGSSENVLMGYKVDTLNNELFLYPVNPICIEGCNNKFKR